MIPGVAVYHPRSEWESPKLAMASSFTRQPPALVIGDVSQMVYHYTAATNLPDGDVGESVDQIPARLAASQLDYLANRNVEPGYRQKPEHGGKLYPGYPLGYSFMVDWLGGVWELRGFDFRPAATNQHNHYTIAVLFYTDGANPGTEAQWAAARAIGRETRRRANRADFSPVFRSHGEMRELTGIGTATACAGAGLESQAPTLGRLDYQPSEDDMPTWDDRRLLDTRQPGIGAGRVAPGVTRSIDIGHPTAKQAIVNITATDPTGPGYFQASAGTSKVNYNPTIHTVANECTVPVTAGRINITANVSDCHLVVDLVGVWL